MLTAEQNVQSEEEQSTGHDMSHTKLSLTTDKHLKLEQP